MDRISSLFGMIFRDVGHVQGELTKSIQNLTK